MSKIVEFLTGGCQIIYINLNSHNTVVEHNRQKADRKIYRERVQNLQLKNLSKSWLNDIQMLATHKQFWPAGCPA